MTKIVRGSKGFSLTREKTLNLANIKIDVESGNPYRNAGTGKFGFELPGVSILMGKRLLKGMPTEAKNALANRVRYTNARQMGIREDEATGELIVVLATEGRILDTFSMPPPQPVEGDSAPEGTGPPSNTGKAYKAAFDPADEILRDAILDAARNLNLDEDQVIAAVEDRIGRELSDAEKHQLKLEVDRQRLEDLVQYLYTNSTDDNTNGMVRIRTPRGYIRRTFAGLDKVQAEKVIGRLQAMGLDDETIKNRIESQMPKRLKREMGIQPEGDEK